MYLYLVIKDGLKMLKELYEDVKYNYSNKVSCEYYSEEPIYLGMLCEYVYS